MRSLGVISLVSSGLFPLVMNVNAAIVVSGTPAQTFSGIGGSSAWWPSDLIHFPEAVRQNLSDLLWTDKGLGLTSYRWNLGGGGLGVSNPPRAIGTFYVGDGVYNWSADPGGQYFVKAAADRQVPIITAFINSAPYPFTTNGQSCGGLFKSGTEAAFGKYIADVLAYFKANKGINVKYISPVNEPDSSFGPVPCGQEGMQVNPNQRAAVITGIYNALHNQGLSSVGIMADETSRLSQATSEYSTWLPQVLDQVAVIAHHTYDFPTDAAYTSYKQLATSIAPTKQTWMSEICCTIGNADGSGRGYSGGYDPTIRNALHFSTLMFQSFIVANEPHYDFWTLVSSGIGCSPLNNPTCVNTANSNGWTDGVIYYDPSYASNGNYQLYLTKHYWTMKHFGNFLKLGAVRYPVSGSNNIIVALKPNNNYAVIVINPANSTTTLSIDLRALPRGSVLRASAAYRTSGTEDFATLTTLPVKSTDGTWSLTLASTSLTSFMFA